jgi:hypothetical protein
MDFGFTLVETPSGLGWAPDPVKRLTMVGPALALHIGLPAVAMLMGRRLFAQPTLLLPAVAWGCTLPLGLAGMLKLGGWTNSIHSFVLWLPAVLTALLTSRLSERGRWTAYLAAAVIAAAIASIRLQSEPNLKLRPQVADHRQAEQFAARHREALYSDRRYYHDEDGMYVRISARKHLSPEHAASQLPAAMRMMAFRNDWTDWGIARRMLPPNSSETIIGNWTLRSGMVGSAPP